jgi:hypothetical protein
VSTLKQSIERAREHESWPPAGSVSVRALTRHFQPAQPRSVRSLLTAMSGKAAKRAPWAVILCRFRDGVAGSAKEVETGRLYHDMFTPGTGGLVEYWRDASLGAIDITGSRVFGPVMVDIPRTAAGVGDGEDRRTLLRRAIQAAQRSGHDPLTGFHGQIAVYTENWSKRGAPAGADWSDPVWGKYWIDGSASGAHVTLTPPHNGDVTAHEMGHGFGLSHDVSDNGLTAYGDPCCVMSQKSTFERWGVPFGPAICVPHLIQAGWMYRRRIHHDAGGWQTQPDGIALPLAATDDPGAPAPLALRLTRTRDGETWDYLIEHVRPTGWNRGLHSALVLVRRLGPAAIVGAETSLLLGTILVPLVPTMAGGLLERAGNVQFVVERSDDAGRTVIVRAKAL